MAHKAKQKKEPSSIDEKMARYHNGVKYSLTINPDDTLQFKPGHGRLAHVRMCVMEMLSEYVHYMSEIDLRIDISYPNSIRAGTYPRVHFHGTVIFSDVLSFLLSLDPHLRSSIEVDTIDDPAYWKQYSRKLEKYHPIVKMYAIRKEQIIAMNVDKKERAQKDKVNIIAMCKQYDQDSEGDSGTEED